MSEGRQDVVSEEQATPQELVTYTGDVLFRNGLDNLLLQPFAAQHTYNPLFNPMRRCIGIFGHELSNKGTQVEMYCQENNIPFKSFHIQPSDSVDLFMTGLYHSLDNGEGERNPRSPLAVVIIHRADYMCFECDTLEAARHSKNLTQWANAYNIIFVCMLDRTPMHSMNVTPVCTQYHQRAFMMQFMDASLYFPSPESSFFKAYLQERMECFEGWYNATIGTLRITLTDADYTVLADAFRWASVGHADAYLTTVWRDLCDTHRPVGVRGEENVGADFFCGAPYITAGHGVAHFVKNLKTLQDGETYFAMQCGGPRSGGAPPSGGSAKKRKSDTSEAFI